MRHVLLIVAACGDNHVPTPIQPIDSPVSDAPADGPTSSGDGPVDAPTDGAQLPDLRWVDSLMDNTMLFMPGTFTANSCEMQEQCIGAPGTRQLMRFDAVSENIGPVDLVVGPPPAAGVSDGNFTWSACHNHHHFNGYAVYELLDANSVVVTGRKQAFCILDSIQRQVGKPSNGYNCANQGLTAGWADSYPSGLACQWLDITGLPSGTYTLRTTINPDGLLIESDTTNNVYETTVTF